MEVSSAQFDKYLEEAFDQLPEDVKERLNNVAILVENHPDADQLKKAQISKDSLLFGLFEGYGQSKRINFGPVLPDRITIFRKAIMKCSSNEQELKQKIYDTLMHEIAHHFGSDEAGARKASKLNVKRKKI